MFQSSSFIRQTTPTTMFLVDLQNHTFFLWFIQQLSVKGTILFSAWVSNEPFSLKSILQTIHNNPTLTAYGDISVDSLKALSKLYKRERIQMEKAFFVALESCCDSKTFADMMVVDPDFPQRTLRRFYVLCQSLSTPAKKDLVNWALLLFSTGLYMKTDGVSYIDLIKDPQTFANEQHSPATIQTNFKTLFVVFGQHVINCSFLKDFNNQGMSS